MSSFIVCLIKASAMIIIIYFVLLYYLSIWQRNIKMNAEL